MDPFYISGYDPDHSNPSHLITHKCSPQDVIISRNPLLMKKITELKPVLCVKNMIKKIVKRIVEIRAQILFTKLTVSHFVVTKTSAKYYEKKETLYPASSIFTIIHTALIKATRALKLSYKECNYKIMAEQEWVTRLISFLLSILFNNHSPHIFEDLLEGL